MSARGGELHIPYLATAEAEVEVGHTPERFMIASLPQVELTPDQIDQFRLYVLGKIHEGIEIGLGMAGSDPLSSIEVYSQGVTEGFRRALEQ